MNAHDAIISLGDELAKERNAAYDLWTWLPSYKEATKHHGDYASNFTPSVREIIEEASTYIAHGLNPSPAQREEAMGYYDCPCGEHDQEWQEQPK